MPTARGTKVTFGWGQEVTWGTAVAAAKWSEIRSEEVAAEEAQTPNEFLRRVSQSDSFQPVIAVSGPVNMEGLYDGQLQLYKHALGAVVDSGAGPDFLHTFTLADDLPVGLTLEVGRELQGFRFPGARVASWDIAIEAGQVLDQTFNFLAKDEEKFTVGAATFPTRQKVKYNHFKFFLAGVESTIRSFSMSLNNNLAADRNVLGSRLIEEPVRNGLREITGSFTRDFQTGDVAALYDKWKAATNIALRLEATGPALGGSNYQWFLDLFRIRLDGAPHVTSDAGIRTVEYPFRAYFDEAGAQDALRLRITNSEAAT